MSAWVLGGEDGTALLVTQTSDVAEAKRILLADPTMVREAAEEWERYEDDPGVPLLTDPLERATAWLDLAEVRVEYGRFACTAWALYEGYRQSWIGWDARSHERAHGETVAVRFVAPELPEVL